MPGDSGANIRNHEGQHSLEGKPKSMLPLLAVSAIVLPGGVYLAINKEFIQKGAEEGIKGITENGDAFYEFMVRMLKAFAD